MDVEVRILVLSLLFLKWEVSATILCESGFCRNYKYDTGCAATAPECSINNATHSGMWLPSPTTCNCCDFCLPLYGRDTHCSRGGPGLGTTVGRCGHGLTCVPDTDGHSYCRRLQSDCHTAQDDFDSGHAEGTVGAMESRPLCDGKGRYGPYECVPTQTCFCQSEEGERLFGEVLNLGAQTASSFHCGCSHLHALIQKSITPGVPYPVVGPRCTSDGNFNPVQCMNRNCFCVNRITGIAVNVDRNQNGNWTVELDEHPITELSCYDKTLDLFPSQSKGEPPYNYTTPCIERMKETIEFLRQSEKDGYNIDWFNEVPGCLPDGTFGRIGRGVNGTKTCIDENSRQIEEYQASPKTPLYEDMDCKCAQTTNLMSLSTERPVCCSNGNFRTVQCRRGLCRCVTSDGKQYGRESNDVTTLPCFKENWRDLDSEDCYAK